MRTSGWEKVRSKQLKVERRKAGRKKERNKERQRKIWTQSTNKQILKNTELASSKKENKN